MKKSWLSLVSIAVSEAVIMLPERVQLFLGDLIGVLWFDIFRIRRKIVLDNLRLCFPTWSEEERVRIGRRSVCNLGRSMIEFLRIPAATDEKYRKTFELKGAEHMQAALQKGRGAFLLSAHIGNGDWASVGLALNGIYLNTVTKEFKLKILNDFWFETRQRFGMTLIPDRKSSIMILKVLKKNGIVGFVMDQFLGPPIGTKIKFFGVETGAPMGLAFLAERSGAAVVPAYTYRDESGRHIIEIEPEIPFVQTGDKEQNIKVNTQAYCGKVEEWIRKHPDQWMWVHRRWKEFRE